MQILRTIRRPWQHHLNGVRSDVQTGTRLHRGLGTIPWAPRSLTIGHDCYIGKGCTIKVDGTIGDFVIIADRVGIIGRRDHDYQQVGVPIRYAVRVGDRPSDLSDPTNIGGDVWIGYGAIVLSGVTVGRGAIVAAGAVVVADVDSYSVVAGIPAQPVAPRFADDARETHEALPAEFENGGGKP